MGTQQKSFEPFEVFPQLCARKALAPSDFGKSIHADDYKTEDERLKAVGRWKKFCDDNEIQLSPKGKDGKRRGVTTIGAKAAKKPYKDAETGEMVHPIEPTVMPKGVSGFYWRLQVKTPLTRPHDLARVFDAQGKVLNPVARTPREDKETDKGYVIPAGATEWYVKDAVIIVAVNSSGRVMVQFWTLDESGDAIKMRVAKWTDLTIPMLEAKVANPEGVKATQARLGDGRAFMGEVKTIFGLVTQNYDFSQEEDGGDAEARHLQTKREMIKARACWKEREKPAESQGSADDEAPAEGGNGSDKTGGDSAERIVEVVTNGMVKDDSAYANGDGKEGDNNA